LQTSKRDQNSFGVCFPKDVGMAFFTRRRHVVLSR